MPVYGRLREYADVAVRTPLLDWLAGRTTRDYSIRHARTLLDALARDGQLLLLDGLDEGSAVIYRMVCGRQQY